MLKKLMLVLCASLLFIPTDALAKRKCKKFCAVLTQALRVCGNATINGNLTVDGTINGIDITNIINTINAIQTDFIFAYSTEIQVYDGAGDTFTPITFNVNSIVDGWVHVPGSADFTIPATGLYVVSYSANIGIPGVADTFPAGIAAFAGPLNVETEIAGSDSSLQVTSPGGATQIYTASSSFLLNGIAGQNFLLGFIADEDSGVSLTNPDLEGIDTSISLTITRIR